MSVKENLKRLFLNHKDELIANGFQKEFDKIRKGDITFNECVSFSDKLSKKGLHNINSEMLRDILSQKNFNYFKFLKQAPLPQDDTYMVDLNKSTESKIDKKDRVFFEDNASFEKNYQLAMKKLRGSLNEESKYLESAAISGVLGEKNFSGHPMQLEEMLNLSRKFDAPRLYGDSSPESSYVIKFDENIDNLKKTIKSLDFGKSDKEVVLLVENKKDLRKLKNDPFLKKNLLSIENEKGIKNVFKKDDENKLHIRLVDLEGKRSKGDSYNLGAFKSLSSNAKYLSFLNNGDIIDEKGYSKLEEELEKGKSFAVGEIAYLSKNGKNVQDVNLKWRKYLKENFGDKITTDVEHYSLFDFSNHLIRSESLEKILLNDNYVFDPRLNEHSFENDFFKRFSNHHSPDQIQYIEDIAAHKEKGINIGENNGKKNIVFMTTTMENTHGVPVVMNNIANNLDKDKYNVFYLVNDFNSKKIKFYGSDRKHPIEANNREELFEILDSYDPSFTKNIDVVHTHTWHFADDFKHFHTKNIHTGKHEEDPMNLKDFLGHFSNAKVVYTDHSNPTEDLENINDDYSLREGYERFSDSKKKEFLEKNKIYSVSGDWKKKWALTSMSGKKQMASLADIVVNVSNSQHSEGQEMIPDYNYSNQKTVYNGIDLIDLTNDPVKAQRIEERSKEIRNENNFRDEDNIILYAGRLSERKGVYDLAKSLKKLKDKTKNNRLVILGDANPAVKDKLKELSGMNNIFYAGRINDREELAAYYKSADLTVQPTHGECFNQVIGESLSQGTPVVATAVSGPKEVYIDNNWAYGFERTKDDKKNVDNLTNAMEDVLKNKDQARDYVKSEVLPQIKEKLSLKRMVDSYDAVYNS